MVVSPKDSLGVFHVLLGQEIGEADKIQINIKHQVLSLPARVMPKIVRLESVRMVLNDWGSSNYIEHVDKQIKVSEVREIIKRASSYTTPIDLLPVCTIGSMREHM